MICYKDKTFCASKEHKGCGRVLTEEEKRHAKEVGLPIASAWFCGNDDQGNKVREV